MSTEPAVTIRGVSFSFSTEQRLLSVLEDVNLTVEPNDFLGIVGPNGGGKTTLLKLILGLLTPQQGCVSVFGQPPKQVRTRIGYVPQHALVDTSVPANVLDVVLMGRLAHSTWGPKFGSTHVDAAYDALRRTGTHDLARRPIRTLSGGQRQRVLIARALTANADLLLLDEPTTGVDAHMEKGLVELLKQLNDTIPIVMVSHDISFVSAHLKRVACLNRTVTVHEAHDISDEVVGDMYHTHVQPVRHDETCGHPERGESGSDHTT